MPFVGRQVRGYDAGAPPTEPDPVDLRAWWKMDEGSGGTLADSSGNGYTGATVGNPSWVQGPTGAANTAIEFNGTDQYLNLTQLGDFGTRIPYTYAIDFWVKWTHSSSMLRFLGTSNTSAVDYTMLAVSSYRDNPGDIDIFTRSADVSTNRFWVTTTAGGLNDGNWHRIQITKSGNSTGNMTVLIDRNVVALTQKDVNMSPSAFGFTTFMAGAAFNNQGTIGNYAPCSLADIRFHNLSQDIWIP